MPISAKILQKLQNAKIEIEIEEIEETSKLDIIKKNGKEATTKHYAKIPCEREFTLLNLKEDIEADFYLKSNFEKYKYIKDYEAIWSTEEKVIECELENTRKFLGFTLLSRNLHRIFGENEYNSEDYNRYEFDNSEVGIKISIGHASIEYALLACKSGAYSNFSFNRRKITIRIENISIPTHEKAQKILEKIGNSLLFKIDMTLNLGLKLAQDRSFKKSFNKNRKSEFLVDKSFPIYEYDKEPISLYWYAKSAYEMPLLQFLALYQILEFYFPIFSQKAAHQQIKDLIKDPRFNANKDSDITRIISAISLNKNREGFGTELEQLKATISSCVTDDDIREVIQQNDMVDFYKERKSKKISNKTFNLENKSTNLINESAERIYEIRCRVVHTKASEKNYEPLLPSSPELKDLGNDITIIEMIVKKIMISTSRLLTI
ncbi:hypothetical protein [Sphingobacterium sp. JUb56]|uniref:hypothetical protein n=1 Tax=Sphingobacterium sp. JUb56 TaxID=2587145 RepID=UPI001622249E|nr:hypothetical protein [Sphingobacterium sp. JUb56]MBB2951578.1 hypothetical protein [Sphingobacterium sp. JUb56]